MSRAETGLRAVVAVLAVCVCACGGSDNQAAASAPIAVLSAFPAETAPLLAQATVADEVTVNGRVFRRGTLAGVPVILGFTGIGLGNAALTTRLVLEQFPVAGVVVSGVAGSTLQIGDVTVAMTWQLGDGTSYDADPPWLALARQLVSSGEVALDRCAMAPSLAPDPVCMPQQPALVVVDVGRSSDPYGGQAFPCVSQKDDLYGCDVPSAQVAAVLGAITQRDTPFAPHAGEAANVNDMETAAIAREAAMRGVPFIAFRAVSDGSGDPLNLPPLVGQFPVYYPFAARNAAAATIAFLERLHNEQR